MTDKLLALAGMTSLLALAATGARAADGPSIDKRRKPAVKIGGYAEGYYGFNFGQPSNGITNYRAFDSRHNAFTLLNAVLAADWAGRRGYGRVALQAGSTGESYYGGELVDAGASGAAGSSIEVWKHIQEAYAGAELGGLGVRLELGVFLSPIGPESMAIKDQWTLSRSDLFYAFPYYQAGIRLHMPVGDRARLLLAALNGYEGIGDKNAQKTVQIAYHRRLGESTELDVQYFVGNERPEGAPEGSPLRHLLDVWLSFRPAAKLRVIVDADVGVEDGELGRSAWASAALWLRVAVGEDFFVATQSDFMREWKGRKGGRTASAIFWDVDWVMSHALCAERRFGDTTALKLEYRFDMAAGDLYFRGVVHQDPLRNYAWIANADRQQTVTLAMTAWF